MKHARKDYDRIQDPANLIPADEPVFLLRAQDRVAAKTVRFWAQAHKDAGGNHTIAQLAMDHAVLMDRWPKKQHADLPFDRAAGALAMVATWRFNGFDAIICDCPPDCPDNGNEIEQSYGGHFVCESLGRTLAESIIAAVQQAKVLTTGPGHDTEREP